MLLHIKLVQSRNVSIWFLLVNILFYFIDITHLRSQPANVADGAGTYGVAKHTHAHR